MMLACAGLVAPWRAWSQSQVYPLDDSATVVHGGSLSMRWRSVAPSPGASTSVDGATVVQLVLDTRAWVGRQARIYMLMAPQIVKCQVQWTTSGVLRDGRIEPGQRLLVFDGMVTSPTLIDTLRVAVTADGRELRVATALRFSYEIEVNT